MHTIERAVWGLPATAAVASAGGTSLVYVSIDPCWSRYYRHQQSVSNHIRERIGCRRVKAAAEVKI